jgi:hypothetical protein
VHGSEERKKKSTIRGPNSLPPHRPTSAYLHNNYHYFTAAGKISSEEWLDMGSPWTTAETTALINFKEEEQDPTV